MVGIVLYGKKMSVPVGTRVIDLLKEEDRKNILSVR